MREQVVYEINKGVGKPLEFKGLKAQYVILFAGGLGMVLLLVIVMAAMGLPSLVPIIVGIVGGGVIVYISFRLNKVYGAHGLMKKRAKAYHPQFIIHRKSVRSMFNTLKANRKKR